MDNDFSNVKLALFDFDGVFTDNNVYITENGKEIVKCKKDKTNNFILQWD